MTLNEFISNLTALVESRPEAGEFQVVTAKDDEGNGYNLVYYGPTIGNLDEDREFTTETQPNAVCVN